MVDTALRVIHTIPGRVRLEVPALKGDSTFEAALKQQMQSL
jgi:hypothetical protein